MLHSRFIAHNRLARLNIDAAVMWRQDLFILLNCSRGHPMNFFYFLFRIRRFCSLGLIVGRIWRKGVRRGNPTRLQPSILNDNDTKTQWPASFVP